MGKRREGREAAMQFLYQRDANKEATGDLLARFWQLHSGPGREPLPSKTRVFVEALVAGVTAHQEEIDRRIQSCVANYDLHRIAAVDRNILRIAVYEMLYIEDVPPVVSINEAIEIAKRFGGEESGRFVNGILDRIRAELPRPARTPATAAGEPQ